MGQIRIPQCKAMDSNQAPLLLSFDNALVAKKQVLLLFKAGDDLRQDVLTLQMIRVMDKLWCKEGIDLQMTPYRCMATGRTQGLIEIVKDSVTTADIHKKIAGVRGAFVEHSMADWLEQQCSNEQEYARAREIFIRSCAGYCVATFLLGIGDRHNDNIMLSKTGHLFRE